MPFSPEYGAAAAVRRDEAKVLGLLAAVRVHDGILLPPDPEDERQFIPPPGQWVAAYWLGAVHVPCHPLQQVKWTKGGLPDIPQERRVHRIPATLWWPMRDGVVLERDRIVRAVRAILSLEWLYVHFEGTVQIVRKARNRLAEAASAGWGTRAGRSAVSKAERVFAKAVDEDRERRGALALTIVRPPEELRLMPAGERKNVAGWPHLQRIRTIAQAEGLRYYPGGTPVELLEELQAARSSASELEKLLEFYDENILKLRPRKDFNPAYQLRHMLVLDDWSGSSAARLWVRRGEGPNLKRERKLAQAVDVKYREELRSLERREREEKEEGGDEPSTARRSGRS